MKLETNKKAEIWFLTGTQHLYGPETLEQVADQSRAVATSLNSSGTIPLNIVWKPILKTADEIKAICMEASANENCVGVIVWMHTFSPAKMWIAGLTALQKPLLPH